MNKNRPTYQELEKRLAVAEPIIEALKHHEVDAVVGEEKITFLLLREVGEALQTCAAEFRALFELPGIGIIQADTPAFGFTRVNQKFCDMTGYSAQELLTQTYIGLTDPQDRQRDMKVLAQVLRGQTDSWSIEKRYVRKDGRVIWVGVHGTALRDETGRVLKFMAMISDITAPMQAKQERHERSVKKGQPQRPQQTAVRKARKSAGKTTSSKPRRKRL